MGVTSSCEKDSEPTTYVNLRFYRNEIKSNIWTGYKIQEMLRWRGEYSKLESKHDYIQWLFPIPDSRGMNYSAKPLLEEEAQAIRDDEITRARVVAAYDMMLDFYGMFLYHEDTGVVCRRRNYQESYDNLNRSTHNFRRISRIIKSLGELGYERFQVPWVTFLLEEIFVTKLLPKLNGGCIQHWIDAIKDKEERFQMYKNWANLKDGVKPSLNMQVHVLSSASDSGGKAEIDNCNTNQETAKIDEKTEAFVHRPGLPTSLSAIDDGGKAGNYNYSYYNARDEITQSNKPDMSMLSDKIEMEHTAGSVTKINHAGDNCNTPVKPDKHINDDIGAFGVETDHTQRACKDKTSCDNGCDDHCVNSKKMDDHAKGVTIGMESPNTVPEKKRFLTCRYKCVTETGLVETKL